MPVRTVPVPFREFRFLIPIEQERGNENIHEIINLTLTRGLNEVRRKIKRRSTKKYTRMHDQNQNCLLVTRQNDNHSPGPGRLVPRSHRRSELSNTILGTFSRGDKSVWKCIPNPNGLGEKATLVNISVSNGDLICHRMIIPAAPNQGDIINCWYAGFTFQS